MCAYPQSCPTPGSTLTPRDQPCAPTPLIKEVAAWQTERNKKHAAADWQFTTVDARVKLKRLYPTL
jgi:hypothetical protein